MKKLTWLMALSAISSVGSVMATEPEEVNFRIANPILQSIVDGITLDDDLVDFAYPRFNESYSSVQAERLKYDLQGSLKSSPRSERAKTHVTVSSTYHADRSAGHTGIATSANTLIRTDVLAMIRYSAQIALKKSYPLDPQFDERYRAHLKRLAVVTTLGEVHELLVSGQRLAKDLAQNEVDKTRASLRCLESGPCYQPGPDHQWRVEYERQKLQDWIGTLGAYDQIHFATHLDGTQVVELVVSSPNLSGFMLESERLEDNSKVIPETGTVSLSRETIRADAKALYHTTLGNLDDLKSKLTENLVGVQNGKAQAKYDAQKFFRQCLIKFKTAIRGEF